MALVIMGISLILLLTALLCLFFNPVSFIGFVESHARVVMALVAFYAVFFNVVDVLAKRERRARLDKKVEDAEKRVQEDPKAPQAAWDLARVKLESYVDRNLSQVRSIYRLTVFVMMVGFALIGIGVCLVYKSPDAFKPGIVAASCGVIVNFIGATFLFLYKSTMAQATGYVAVLERINAVGMSVQILENIDGESKELKHKTMADLAMQLLAMYSERGTTVNSPSIEP